MSKKDDVFKLKGFERFFTLHPDTRQRIVHVMVVSRMMMNGPNDEPHHHSVQVLVKALMKVVNQHPRLRVKQQKQDATIQLFPPFVKQEEIESYLIVDSKNTTGSTTNTTMSKSKTWQEYVQDQCNLTNVNCRNGRFPFELHIWYEVPNQMRLMLFTDHYMSDGFSGYIILDEFLQALSNTNCYSSTSVHHQEPYATIIPKSLFDAWLLSSTSHLLRTRLCTFVLKLVGKYIAKGQIKTFKPLIQPASNQKDFILLTPLFNETQMLFHTSSCQLKITKILKRCQEEKVTVGGALLIAVMAAFAKQQSVAKNVENNTCGEHFKIAMQVDYNMRPHLSSSTNDCWKKTVGMYMNAVMLDFYSTKGIKCQEKFWCLARDAKNKMLTHQKSLQFLLPPLFCHELFNGCTTHSSLLTLKVPSSISCDVNVSNIGKYPFNPNIKGEFEMFQVKSVHVCNSSPHYAPGAIVYLTFVNGTFGYSMAHKYSPDVGQQLFNNFIQSIETIEHIKPNMTFQQLVDIL